MKRNLFAIIIGLLLLLIFALLLCVFQVRQSEVAVVTTFGNPTRPITEAGPHWKLPPPIQRVYKFDQRVQNFEDGLTQGLTSDGFNLAASAYIGWRITDPASFFPKFIGSAEPIAEAERRIGDLLTNTKLAIMGKHRLFDFLSTSEKDNSFGAIEDEIFAAVQSQLSTNNYGLKLEFLGLKRLQLPEGVTQKVFDRMQAERKRLAEAYQSEGERRASETRSGAESKAEVMLANAGLQASYIRGEAEAEAAKSLSVFQQNPALANFLFRVNALESSLNSRSILIFDQHTPPFDLFQGVSTNLLSK